MMAVAPRRESGETGGDERMPSRPSVLLPHGRPSMLVAPGSVVGGLLGHQGSDRAIWSAG